MRKNEIKPGVVYACQRSRADYATPEPIVFLTAPADGRLYKTAGPYRKPGTPAYVRAREDAKPGRGRGFSGTDIGYPVVQLSYDHRKDVGPQELLKPALAEFEKCTSGYDVSVDGVRFELMTNLTQIIGPYDEVMAAHEAKRAAEHEQDQHKKAERDAARERNEAICGKLEALGSGASVTYAPNTDYRYVTLSVADAEKLIATLAAARDAAQG